MCVCTSAVRSILVREEYNQLQVSNQETEEVKSIPSDANLVATQIETLVTIFS